MNRKVVVAVAPVGADISSPSVNPLTPEDVAAETISCARAGASMVHLHVRDRQGNQTEPLKGEERGWYDHYFKSAKPASRQP